VDRERTHKVVVVARIEVTRKQQDALSRKLGDRHLAAVNKLVADRQHEQIAMPGDAAKVQILPDHGVAMQESNVDLFAPKLVQQVSGSLGHVCHVDSRKTKTVAPKKTRSPSTTPRRWVTDHELTDFTGARTADGISCSLYSRQHDSSLLEEEPPDAGELYEARRPVEKSDTQLALEALHLLTQGSLGQVFPICSMAKVPLLCDRNEVLQLTKLHDRP
jgi:hypothetical protein